MLPDSGGGLPDRPVSLPEATLPTAEAEEAAGPGLLHYGAVIWRRKWLILLLTVVGTGAGVAVARLTQLEYQAELTLWFETPDREGGPIRSGQALQANAWIDLLQSNAVLGHVVHEQRLYLEPAAAASSPVMATFSLSERMRPGEYRLAVDSAGVSFLLTSSDAGEVQRGTPGEAMGQAVGFDWAPPAETLTPGLLLDFTVRNPREAAGRLGGNLEIEIPKREGNFIRLSLQGTDRYRTAATLNSVGQRLVDVAAQVKRGKLDEVNEVLREQLNYAEQRLRDAEIALETFRVQTVTLPSDQAAPPVPGGQATQAPAFQAFFDLKLRRDQLREEREEIERALGATASSVDLLAAIPSVQSRTQLTQVLQEYNSKSTELRTLRQRYTDEHPSVRQLDEETRQLWSEVIPELAGALRDELLSQEADLDLQIAAASADLRDIPPRSIEEGRLERAVATADNLHAVLKQRYETSRLAAASTVADVRIIDAAPVPNRPIEDKRILMVILGFGGSFAFSIAGVLLADRLNPRVRYAQQVISQLGLPVLGAVPHVVRRADGAGTDNQALVAEAFREICFSVVHAHGTAGPVVFTVSSPEPGDGKSFVASNLAFAFARQGQRALLIDGDIRRGKLHELFGADRTPGFTDLLMGDAKLDQVIQATDAPTLSLISSGTRLPNGPELLASSNLPRLIREFRPNYSVIIIDSPPLGAGTDPYILGATTGNLLMVLRTNVTNRAFAEAKLGLFDRLPVRLLGAVLNAVPADQKAYQYYFYLPGYDIDPADDGAVATALHAGTDTGLNRREIARGRAV